MAAFVANVGVNSSHAARSPLFADRTFQLVPVPERQRWRKPMVKLEDLPDLAGHAPPGWGERAVHLDPDLTSSTPTYGDNCRRAGRAFSLRNAVGDDLIAFVARLHGRDGLAGFYLVGCLVVDEVIADVTEDPGAGWWDHNAHVLRARATRVWDSFWVFRGGPRSRLLARAIPFTRREAEAVFGSGWLWRGNRTELQTIGSYTRAVRRVGGCGEEWLRATTSQS